MMPSRRSRSADRSNRAGSVSRERSANSATGRICEPPDRNSSLRRRAEVDEFSEDIASASMLTNNVRGGWSAGVNCAAAATAEAMHLRSNSSAIPIVRAMSKICSGDVSGKAGHLVSASWATTSPVLESTIG